MKKKSSKPVKAAKSKQKAMLFGLGLDNKDGHTRITTGDNFKLIGGTEETHGTMQEKAIKVNEHLKRRGKTLDTVSPTNSTRSPTKSACPSSTLRRRERGISPSREGEAPAEPSIAS